MKAGQSARLGVLPPHGPSWGRDHLGAWGFAGLYRNDDYADAARPVGKAAEADYAINAGGRAFSLA